MRALLGGGRRCCPSGTVLFSVLVKLCECARDSHPFVPAGLETVAHYAFQIGEAPNHYRSASPGALVLTTGRTHRRMRIPAKLDQATEIAGRPLQPISRFQQISANLRATATRAFFAPERLRMRW
jgi:hypothetical protein